MISVLGGFRIRNEGQSVLEFLFMLPLLLGIVIILLRVNTAIQISIVDQQYARAQALFLANNQAFYPVLVKQQRLINTATNQLIVGVSDNAAPLEDEEAYSAQASIQWIAGGAIQKDHSEGQQEPPIRANVRIRNTVTLCTQSLTVSTSSGSMPLLALDSQQINPLGPVSLSQGSFLSPYCGSTEIHYEQ